MDTDALRKLLDQRDSIDEQIRSLITGAPKERKTIKCSICDTEGHTARTCSQKQQ